MANQKNNTGNKSSAKSGQTKSTAKVKTKKARYKDDIRYSYDMGYARGWDDAYDIPNRLGTKTVAAMGYKKGLRNRRRSDKYIKQYNRGGKK